MSVAHQTSLRYKSERAEGRQPTTRSDQPQPDKEVEVAILKICKIDDCGKNARTRGLCVKHYHRQLRYGDPLGGGPDRGEAQRFYENVVLTDTRGPDDPCLIWPFARNSAGYAHRRIDGKNELVSRMLCEERHGPPSDPKDDAAHNCGKGAEGCVTRSHLDWKTRKENMADTLIHGTHIRGERSGTAKLTKPETEQIIMLKDYLTQREIGDLFGVTQTTVSMIHTSKTWV